MGAIRVLIADDEPTMRAALADALTAQSLEVVGQASDAEEAIDLAGEMRPDVALLDVRMPGGGGPRAAREIRRRSPDTRVIALSAYQDRGSVLEMLEAGTLGYVTKGTRPEEIGKVIRRAVNGLATFSGEITTDVVRDLVDVLDRDERPTCSWRRKAARIERAIVGEEPEMVFQPIVELEDGKVVCLEALARFRLRPKRSPDLWFAEAAAVGLLIDLELKAVRAALAHMDRLPAVFLSVNVSPETINSRRFQEALTTAPIDRVVIELSEHASIRSYEGLTWSIERLRERGVRLAIDDAGADFESLLHVMDLAPEFIKLDVALTRGVEHDRARRALASSLVSIAATVGADVIAEGIETEEELAALRGLGIRYGQGFYFGRPGPLEGP